MHVMAKSIVSLKHRAQVDTSTLRVRLDFNNGKEKVEL